jgi:hypothetical protein
VSLFLSLRLYKLSPHTSRLRKLTALIVLAVSLFPIVSITDDFLRAAYWTSLFDTRTNAGKPLPDEKGNESSAGQLQLIRAFDAFDTAQTSPSYVFEEALAPSEWTVPSAARSCDRVTETARGRAPPTA